MEVLDKLKVHQCEEVPTRKIAAFSYFYDRAVDAGILQKGESAVVQVRGLHGPEKKGVGGGEKRDYSSLVAYQQ